MGKGLNGLRVPAISVVMLCYNHASFVAQALFAFDRQTFNNFEMIIVDDFSSDGSLDIINSWAKATELRHRIISNTSNRGICRGINHALEYARGEFICVIAADDWPESDFLEQMHAILSNSSSTVAFAFADVKKVDRSGEVIDCVQDSGDSPEEFSSDKSLFHALLADNFVAAPAVLIRRHSLDAVGGYDEDLAFEDYDMWLKLSFQFSAKYVPKPLVNYRILPTSMSRAPEQYERMKNAELLILEKWKDSTSESNVIIAHHMRSICYELLKRGVFELANEYMSVAQSLSPSAKWNLFAFFSSIPMVRWIVQMPVKRAITRKFL